jgi:hypothetical protein
MLSTSRSSYGVVTSDLKNLVVADCGKRDLHMDNRSTTTCILHNNLPHAYVCDQAPSSHKNEIRHPGWWMHVGTLAQRSYIANHISSESHISSYIFFGDAPPTTNDGGTESKIFSYIVLYNFFCLWGHLILSDSPSWMRQAHFSLFRNGRNWEYTNSTLHFRWRNRV